MLTVNDVFAIIEPKFGHNILFEHCTDDDELFECFDKFMFGLVEDGDFDGYEIFRAEWVNQSTGESTFHFTVDGCKKVIILNCRSERITTN